MIDIVLLQNPICGWRDTSSFHYILSRLHLPSCEFTVCVCR